MISPSKVMLRIFSTVALFKNLTGLEVIFIILFALNNSLSSLLTLFLSMSRSSAILFEVNAMSFNNSSLVSFLVFSSR
ncbi:hypothetical protein D3C81_659160 [compost metagenome]